MTAYRESYIFRIGTPETAVFWTGHGDLLIPADTIIPFPEVALGGGDLVNMPELELLLNGVAQRVDVVLSGVSESTLRLAMEEAPDVPGAPVNIGRIRFDEEWQQSDPVEWEWEGEARNLVIGGQPSESGRTRSLTLKIAAGDTTRSRPALAYFTDSDQRRSHPTDAVFSHVAGLNAGTSRRFGPK